MNVGHFIPAYGSSIHPMVWKQAHAETRASIEHGYGLTPVWLDVLGIDKARNLAIETAIESGIEYLFMQDADTWAESAVIPDLIKALRETGATIAGAPYRLRRKTRDVAYQPVAPEHIEAPGIYEVEMVGTGLICLDIHRLKKQCAEYTGPWCDRTYVDGRHTELALGGDYWLSRVVRTGGGKVVVDTRLTTGHVFTDVETLRYQRRDTARVKGRCGILRVPDPALRITARNR